MKRVDVRTLSHETAEHIRRLAVRRVHAGERPSAVIRSYGLCRTVGRLLAELAITPQKPLRSADERDPVAIERWQREAFLRLRTRAKRVAAKRFFLDEAGVDLVHARTQEPKLGDRELERPLAAEPWLQRVRVEARRRAARERAGLRQPERELAGARPRDRPTAGRAQPRRRGDLPVSRV